MMQGNQLSRVARAVVSLLISVLVVCTAWTGAQERTSVEAAQPQQGAIINPAQLAPETYAQILTQLNLTAKDSYMEGIFPATTTGAALARVATLVPLGTRQDYLPEARQMGQDLALLRRDPDGALGALETGFGKMAATYWKERQFLIQIGGHLKAPRASVVTFLEGEMSRSVAIDTGNQTDLAYISPAIAADTFLAIVPSTAERDAAFTRAVNAQTDVNIKRLILSRYERVDAEDAITLARQLGLLNNN